MIRTGYQESKAFHEYVPVGRRRCASVSYKPLISPNPRNELTTRLLTGALDGP